MAPGAGEASGMLTREVSDAEWEWDVTRCGGRWGSGYGGWVAVVEEGSEDGLGGKEGPGADWELWTGCAEEEGNGGGWAEVEERD
jgi:hypothetical protein